MDPNIRSRLQSPLDSMVLEDPLRMFTIIITLNDQYVEGREHAKRTLARLVQEAMLAHPLNVYPMGQVDAGGISHPFAFGVLSGTVISELIALDNAQSL